MKKQKVYRAYCRAGMQTEHRPDTPKKVITVFFPDEALSKTPDPRKNAQWFASELVHTEIANDPDFKSGCWWETLEEEADLSQYLRPNLKFSSGAKVWYN